ncbi:MATE family efflux transporter [Litorimonas cladophorae]|uniref:MATE family efflux transporter n=2 Tax=Litorimonas cladophorae TaxID=1220491 RepID=A0A918NHU4_9PROT|nr:MATE family efflux transporter [Litorimonas cladophorae]
MLANGAAPIVGLVDTLMVGRFVGTQALAGIGLGAVVYSIAYWGFGFLRMSTAGLAAQSDGAGAEHEVQAHIMRAIPLGVLIGLLIFIFQVPLLAGAFTVFTASAEIENSARDYIGARLWGLPATLGTIALMGWFVGISRAGLALGLQIVLNIVNIILSPIFVIVLGGGLIGVGLASAAAEWAGFATGMFLMIREVKRRGGWRPGAFTRKVLLARDALSKLGVANGNIFIRTMALTLGFSFFGNAAASEGETFLAGYHVLMQFITMSALVLDGFAHTAEAVTGAAYGAKDRKRFDRAVRLTSEFSVGFALLISGCIYFGGPLLIPVLTTDPAVIESALTYLPYCALVPIAGFAAFQMDGIFIGTTRTAAMRNAGIAAVIIYIGAHYMIYPIIGAAGIWVAFLVYYVMRAATLAVAYPAIRKAMEVVDAD